MDGPSSFTEAIRAVAGGLREDPPSHLHLNRAAARIDFPGRQLHGHGYLRGGEMADRFTAALGALSASHRLPDEVRTEVVREAACHLEAALDAAAAGVLPPAS